jgi:hypothetical protein
MRAWLTGVSLLACVSAIAATCDSTTQGPIELCFTVDQSGSIDDTEYDELNNFITDIVEAAALPGATEFPLPGSAAVVLFATTARVAVPLTNNATEVLAAVYPRLSSGRTALTEGVDQCVTTLIDSNSHLQKVMIILTDGVNNENSTRTPDEIRIRAEEAGIFVIALAIGDETDPTALRAYLPLKAPVGVLYYATDFSTGLQNLISSVITEVNDADEDGVCNDVDACPGFDDRIDSDGDGVPDGCDICPNDPSIQYSEDPDYGVCGCDGDTDGDGVCNSLDICQGFDDHVDSDGDGVPDGCDICKDDASISCATDPKYLVCGCDGDDDEDGVCNKLDICPGFDDNIDIDEDGHPDACDNCGSVYNPDQADGNKNGLGDACEIDMCEYKHGAVEINASCVHNCGGGRWSNCKDVCALFGVPFVSNVQCNNAGIALDISPPGPYNDRCDRTKVCCMCRPFVNNYPIMKAHLRGPHHRGHVHHDDHHDHHEEDCDCEDLLD